MKIFCNFRTAKHDIFETLPNLIFVKKILEHSLKVGNTDYNNIYSLLGNEKGWTKNGTKVWIRKKVNYKSMLLTLKCYAHNFFLILGEPGLPSRYGWHQFQFVGRRGLQGASTK